MTERDKEMLLDSLGLDYICQELEINPLFVLELLIKEGFEKELEELLE